MGNLKYTLVYVPEGNRSDSNADVFDTADTLSIDEESEHLIDRYTQIVCGISPKTTVCEFTSDSKDRSRILDDFACGKLEVLTSMKCLDEGVDVPRSEMAIFCASTGNPRQFVQRRGRILRKYPGKTIADIYDVVLLPKQCPDIAKIELKRVYEYAKVALNKTEIFQEIGDLLKNYNISIQDIVNDNEDLNGGELDE